MAVAVEFIGGPIDGRVMEIPFLARGELYVRTRPVTARDTGMPTYFEGSGSIPVDAQVCDLRWMPFEGSTRYVVGPLCEECGRRRLMVSPWRMQ